MTAKSFNLSLPQALEKLFDRSNAMGAAQGIVSEQQVYDIIADK